MSTFIAVLAVVVKNCSFRDHNIEVIYIFVYVNFHCSFSGYGKESYRFLFMSTMDYMNSMQF